MKMPLSIAVLLLGNVLVWGIPVARLGRVILFPPVADASVLIVLFVYTLPCVLALAISTLGFFVLWKTEQLSAARAMGVTFLVFGLGAAGCTFIAAAAI